MEKVFRGLINLLRITSIKLRCQKAVDIYAIQPMRIKSQLMIQKHVKKVMIKKNFKLETDAKIRVIDGGTLEIGNNVWIGAGSIILRGAKIEDNCVIAAGTVVKGLVPHDCMCYQKRESNIISIRR